MLKNDILSDILNFNSACCLHIAVTIDEIVEHNDTSQSTDYKFNDKTFKILVYFSTL